MFYFIISVVFVFFLAVNSNFTQQTLQQFIAIFLPGPPVKYPPPPPIQGQKGAWLFLQNTDTTSTINFTVTSKDPSKTITMTDGNNQTITSPIAVPKGQSLAVLVMYVDNPPSPPNPPNNSKIVPDIVVTTTNEKGLSVAIPVETQNN